MKTFIEDALRFPTRSHRRTQHVKAANPLGALPVQGVRFTSNLNSSPDPRLQKIILRRAHVMQTSSKRVHEHIHALGNEKGCFQMCRCALSWENQCANVKPLPRVCSCVSNSSNPFLSRRIISHNANMSVCMSTVGRSPRTYQLTSSAIVEQLFQTCKL